MLLEEVIQRGDRASQPAANAVGVGTLYLVDDENDIIERSNGATWDPAFAGTNGDGTFNVLAADPASPVDGTFWVVITGVSPTATATLKVRTGGVTLTIAEVTF
jgi:hypothetical protein